jgi:hypothetical protein
MKLSERLLSTGLLSVSLALGGCAVSEVREPTVVDNDPVAEAALAQLEHYWTQRGVVGMTALKLVTLGDTVYYCRNLDDSISRMPMYLTPAAYCRDPDVVITNRGALDTIATVHRADYKIEDGKLAALAHEIGHRIEQEATNTESSSALVLEQRADCLAGVAIANIKPEALPSARLFYEYLPPDAGHGSAADRVAKFDFGAQHPDTLCDAIIPGVQ